MAHSYDRRKEANWATLFVYGSLRRAGTEHHKMEDTVFMGTAVTAPMYALQPIRDFVGLVPGTESVPGELYLCSPAKLAELDEWEYDIFIRTTILLAGGRQAQAYMLASAQRTAAEYKDKIPGGLADKGPPPGVSKDQVEKGVKVELEHTDDEAIAREIAYDHLTEDPKYYDKLETIEKHAGYDRRAAVGLVLYDEGHLPGMRVPKGGSSCATCHALSKDGLRCANPHFQRWRRSLGAEDPALIPAPADEYCSDWYTPVPEAMR